MKGHELGYFFSLGSQERVFAYQSMLAEREYKAKFQSKFLEALAECMAGLLGGKVKRRR